MLARVTLVARDLFQACVCVSPARLAFFIEINTCVSKFVQLGCKGRRIGFMCRQSPFWGWGGGGGGKHLFCFGVRLFNPPSPMFFLLSCSSPIAFSPACPVTHLLSPRPLLSERPLRIDYWKTNQEVTGLEIKKILRSTFGDQQEKYSRKMQIFSRQFE